MSLENVKKYFEQYGMTDRIRVFDVSSATVDLAAQALSCDPKRIAKTLSFMVEGQPILIVTSGDGRVDNQKFKAFFEARAKMVKADELEDLVGHGAGGVCPFAIKDGVKVYLDQSLKRFETVFPACGSANSAIELSLPELEKHSNFSSWVDVCKDWE